MGLRPFFERQFLGLIGILQRNTEWQNKKSVRRILEQANTILAHSMIKVLDLHRYYG